MRLEDIKAVLKQLSQSPIKTGILLILLLSLVLGVSFLIKFVEEKAEVLVQSTGVESSLEVQAIGDHKKHVVAIPEQLSQDTRITSVNNSKKEFFVSSSLVTTKEPLPKINCVLTNRSKLDQVIIVIVVQVLEYLPYASIPKSRVLEPIAVIDIVLPFSEGEFRYKLSEPVLISSGESATIQLRIMVKNDGNSISPSDVALYKLKFLFETVDGLLAETGEIIL